MFQDFGASLSAGSAPWKYLSGDTGGNSFTYIANADYGLYLENAGVRELVLHVPVSGYYQIEALAAWWARGSYAAMALTPSDESGAKTGDPIALGTLDMYQEENGKGTFGHRAPLTQCRLEAGYYVLSMNLARVDGTRRFGVVDALRLNYLEMDVQAEAPAPVQEGARVRVPLSLRLADALDQEISCKAIQVKGLDKSIAAIQLDTDGKSLIVTGIGEGSGVAEIQLQAGGAAGVLYLPVAVYNPYTLSEDTYTYSFYKIDTGTDLKKVDNFNQTTTGASGEKNLMRESMPWRFDHSADNPAFQLINQHGYGALLSATKETSIRIRVPKSGRYQVISQNWFWTEGGELSIAIQSADGTGAYGNKTELGSFDTYLSKNGENVRQQTPVNTVDLPAGDYIVSYGVAKTGSSGSPRVGISALILKGVPVEKELVLAVSAPENLLVGESVKLPVSLTMAGGLPLDTSRYTITIEQNSLP